MARFPASLAANMGKCDLDAANYIRLPGSGSLADIAKTQGQRKRHFGSG